MKTELYQTDAVNPLETNSLTNYFNRIGKVALLKADEEVELAKDIEVGLYAGQILLQDETTYEHKAKDLKKLQKIGEAAHTAFLEANLRLVVSVAMRYKDRSMPLWDLIQEGNLGLLRALERFDYAKGYKFSTFATSKIYEGVIRSFYDQGRSNPLKRTDGEQLSKLGRIERELELQLERKASEQELADAMNLPVEKIKELIYLNRTPISIDMSMSEYGTEPLGNFIEDGEDDGIGMALEVQSLRDSLDTLLSCLDEEEYVLLSRSMGYGSKKSTYAQIGEELGISARSVEWKKKNLIEKLRDDNDWSHLRDYLG